MAQAPMIAVPLKATNEIDWIVPLKSHIRSAYGDDPERYAEECATLNRLRQDMRGASKESISGRDMLYRYYGQLELLDLRFPVDEQHIKISFTWFDAFTHKPTSQFSLAFEKASVIFNISAVLSCYAVFQDRSTDVAIKTAYHSFQASAGMFTYINENFLHAPSTDLSRETVKTLISVMLAQAQEVFIEKQAADGVKIGLRAKLAAQAGYLYGQALEGVQENVTKAIFEKVWLTMTQIKTHYFNSVAQYYQACADDDANQHGTAVSRLQVAETLAKEAEKLAKGFPSNPPSFSHLSAETGGVLQEMTKRQLSTVQERLKEALKDNDFIYHQTVPVEAALPAISKLQAAKPIPVSELYAGQDITRITGPDLFAKLVPLAVTESASLYDEEKAKLVRAETEKVDQANSEMAASLDYLRLPGALQVLKGGFDQEVTPDEDFTQWCNDIADHENPGSIIEVLNTERNSIVSSLDRCAKQLDMEESVCEKMRSKFDSDWTQQPSSRLTSTLRGDIRGYREALDEASKSDGQLGSKLRQNAPDIDEMRKASQTGEIDQMFQQEVAKARAKGSSATSPAVGEPNLLDADFDESEPSVQVQIAKVEELMKKLNQVKRERNQVLKDLKDKVHNDDISSILIFNKKSISSHEQQLFQSELEKFRPHQNRLLQANHKQSSLMKELSAAFNVLLQDKRVRSEQSKWDAVVRSRNTVANRYKRAYQEFLELYSGLQGAKTWYKEMKDTVGSLDKNVETFVNNRRSEGAQLLDEIERKRSNNKSAQAQLEQERLRGLMERMSMDHAPSPPQQQQSSGRPVPTPLFQPGQAPRYIQSNYHNTYGLPTSPPPNSSNMPQPNYSGFSSPAAHQQSFGQPPASTYSQPTYNPLQYGRTPGPTSPPATQTSFHRASVHPASPPPTQTSFGQQHQYGTYGAASLQQQSQQQQQQQQNMQSGYVPQGFVPPPPPPGPPPLGPQQTMYEQGRGQQQGQQQQQQGQGGSDPWAGLSAWR